MVLKNSFIPTVLSLLGLAWLTLFVSLTVPSLFFKFLQIIGFEAAKYRVSPK
jgi:hypothetical protein